MARPITDPPLIRKMFYETGAWTWVWLVVRLYVGYEWFVAGYHKINDAAWMSGGSALKAFWERIVVVPVPPARPAITYDWYRMFIEFLLNGEHYIWFSKLISFGELCIGIALILGAFVGVAALFGAFMNFNFMLAGSASTNPVLFLGGLILVLAWKTAGHWGVDRFLLPRIGVPWNRKKT